MTSRYIGLVIGERTGRVYTVVSTETDAELDHPSHLGIEVEKPEPLRLVKWERSGRTDFSTFENIASVITEFYVHTHYQPDEPPYGGPEILDIG